MNARVDKQESDQRGLRCRWCGSDRFRVVYTRRAWGRKVVRRRECRICGERLMTWERAIGGA
jgi:transcriptional regulator NrdR family protein